MPFDGQVSSPAALARPATQGFAIPAVAVRARRWPRHPALARASLSLIAAGADAGAILAATIIAGTLYHAAFYEAAGMLENLGALGFTLVALFILSGVLRRDYEVGHLLSFSGQYERIAFLWSASFACFAILAFVTKTGADVSRGTIILTYLAGFPTLAVSRAAMVSIVQSQARAGGAAERRIFLVGSEPDLIRFREQNRPGDTGMKIVSAAVVRGEESLEDDLTLAAAAARVLRPDDVYILAPWSDTRLIENAVNAFLSVPASLHLGSGRVLDRFSKARIERAGPVVSLNLTRQPLGIVDVILKRAVDIVGASVALVLLSPAFAVFALLIKLDSPGPAFFTQRRYGFNQEPFRIVKFRSMSTMEDGRIVTQATVGDPRITRIGRFIRRYNIDELPQLFNVLRGDMSLVGPRPHAMAHDQKFEPEIALYARRHNVRPGITGWAQVNGYRGETATADQMRGRIEHDLYYIDHWSIGLDLRILFLTVFSRKAYRNAR